MNLNAGTIRKAAVAAALLAAVTIASCSKPGGGAAGRAGAGGKIIVFVSIPPQEYFVQRIGGGRFEARALVAPGQSPHSYQPTPRQMEDLSRAAAYFRIGVPFEEAIVEKIKSMNPDLAIVDTRKNIKLESQEIPDEHEEEHAGGGEEMDPHIWLDPRLVKTQAETIYVELERLDPEHKQEFRDNLDVFQAELNVLFEDLSAALAPLKGRKFYVFHPAFGYFGRAFGLEQVSVETGGKEPSAKQLAALIAQAKADGVKVIFVQAQFPAKSADAVAAAIGGAVIPLDPLARDYIENMKEIADKVKTALQK